ncbi:MAG: hypothetical protein NT062_31570 [Proteobacteria bacterium]|nr:hypothetical protein [Pseudomonadota bacterium]
MRQVVLGLLVLAACGPKGSPASPTPASTTTGVTTGDPTCPLVVEGTSIAAEDADGGVALVFVTTGDAAAVRGRAQHLAQVHNQRVVDGELLKAGCDGCMADTIGVPSTATVLEVPGGAKVVFAAKDPAAVAELQAQARMHANHLSHATGSCQMAM